MYGNFNAYQHCLYSHLLGCCENGGILSKPNTVSRCHQVEAFVFVVLQMFEHLRTKILIYSSSYILSAIKLILEMFLKCSTFGDVCFVWLLLCIDMPYLCCNCCNFFTESQNVGCLCDA